MSFSDTETNRSGDWKYLWREIRRRTRQPFSGVPFVFHVFLAIIVLGCLGIWVELTKVALAAWEDRTYDGVFTALATFFPALIGSSSLQLILDSTGKSDKVLVSFGILVSFIALAAAVLISVFHQLLPCVTFGFSIFFALLAVWLWWFTNGDDPTYKSVSIDAPSGGDPKRKPKGDTSGFRQ